VKGIAVRIWYQSLFDGGRMPAYFEGLKARAKSVARPGVEVHFHGMPEGVYGGRVPSDVVIYPYLVSLHVQFILDNALRAEAEGYDVFAIGSVQDPGIEEARSLVDIPVVGYGEAAMHFACLLGSRFALVAFGAGFDQMLDLRVKKLGLAERALPTALMDASFADVGRGLEDSRSLVEKFSGQARQLIARGAEAIIPGQLYLSEAIARAGVTRIDEVPIVDGLAATLKMAEAMADLKRLGVSVTRRGYTHARPTADMIEHARNMHGRPPLAEKDR
jgi:Asp/Glu/hydantoin racemase